MFRMGGSSGTGITSGLDRPGYRNGTDPDPRSVRSLLPQLGSLPPEAPKKPTGLGLGTIPGFLTQFGLNLATQAPTGNIFSTAAAAAKEPFGTFQQAKFAEAKEEREFEREKQLQLLKNLDEDDRIQIQKEAEILSNNPESEFFGKYNEAEAMLANKKIYGVQFMPGEERKAAIKKRADELRAARIPDIIATRQATFFVDFPKVEKANPDISFDIEQPFFIGKDQKYKEGFVYYDPIDQIYLRRDSTITGGETPGFENITGEIK